MAKYYKLLVISLCLLLTACQEGGEAGDLWGQWKMVGTAPKYIAFSGSVAAFRTTYNNKLTHEIFGNFQNTGDSVFIQCYSIKGDPADTTTIENDYGLKPFTNIRLKIEALDCGRLILSKGNKKWNFEKY